MPGTLGNANAQTHGVRSARLPRGCRYIERQVRAWRQRKFDELAARGTVEQWHLDILDAMVKHKTRGMLAERHRRRDEMASAEEDRFSAIATAAADAIVDYNKRLGLDKPPDPYAVIMNTPLKRSDPKPASGSPEAAPTHGTSASEATEANHAAT